MAIGALQKRRMSKKWKGTLKGEKGVTLSLVLCMFIYYKLYIFFIFTKIIKLFANQILLIIITSREFYSILFVAQQPKGPGRRPQASARHPCSWLSFSTA